MNKKLIGHRVWWRIPPNKMFNDPEKELDGEIVDKIRVSSSGSRTAYLVVTSTGEVHVVEPHQIDKIR